jgi:hypothetical protein
MTAATTREFLRARLTTLVLVACVIAFGIVAGAATAAGTPPPNGCKPSGNKPKKCNPAPAPSPPAPAPPAPPAPLPAPPPPAPSPAPPPPAASPAPPPPAPGVPSGGSGQNGDGTTRTTAPEADAPATGEADDTPAGEAADAGDDARGSDTGSIGSDTGSPGHDESTPAPPPAAAEASLERTAEPSNSALEAAKTGFEPAIAAVRPALAHALHASADPVSTTASYGRPTFGGAAPSVVAEQVLRHWFAPHALVVLAHDVMPGLHSIRAKLDRHASTFVLGFGRPVATKAARRQFVAAGWLRSDDSGVTVCIRTIESYRHRTIRTSETCAVAHRDWHRVVLKSRTVARGHRLTVSVYEFGASTGDSFDVGGFRVSQR